MPVSLRPSDTPAPKGPSKDKDVLVTIESAKFVPDYKRGKSTFSSVAAEVHFRTAEGDEYAQFYKVGSPDWFAVTSDGKQITSAKPDEVSDDNLHISPKQEFYQFLLSLAKNGVPEEKLGNSITNLVGIKGTIRAFVTETYDKKDDKGQVTGKGESLSALFTKVEPASVGKSTGSTAAASTPASSDALSGYVKAVLETIIPSGSTFNIGDGAKDLKAAALKAFVKVKSVPKEARADVSKLIADPDTVNALDGFLYDADAGTIQRS